MIWEKHELFFYFFFMKKLSMWCGGSTEDEPKHKRTLYLFTHIHILVNNDSKISQVSLEATVMLSLISIQLDSVVNFLLNLEVENYISSRLLCV